jgi:hypothetical protein
MLNKEKMPTLIPAFLEMSRNDALTFSTISGQRTSVHYTSFIWLKMTKTPIIE